MADRSESPAAGDSHAARRFVKGARRAVQGLRRRSYGRRSSPEAVIGRSGLFDGDWYRAQLANAGDVQGETEQIKNPVLHYIERGWRDGLDPNPLFNSDWYLSSNPDVAASGENPLVHYIVHGSTEGRAPHPLFDSGWYAFRYRDVADAGADPLAHYLRNGAVERRDPHPLFSAAWYVTHYPDVHEAGINPLIHYIRYGAAEGRDPHPLFNTSWYLARNPDAALAGENPLAYYLRHGSESRSDPHPLFDSDWYVRQSPDLATTRENPLVHFVRYGAAQGYDPNPFFDTDWYLAQYPDTAAAGENALIHYVRAGAVERRNPSPIFHAQWYSEQANVPASQNPLLHFLTEGLMKGYAPNPEVPAERISGAVHRAKMDQGYRFAAAHLTPPHAYRLPSELEQFLYGAFDTRTFSMVRACFHFLEMYKDLHIDDEAADNNPEIRQLIAEITALAARKGSVEKGKIAEATIVIPVHNKLAYTLCCLKALLASPTRCKYEIIIGDDGSTDATARVLAKIGGIVRVQKGTRKNGFCEKLQCGSGAGEGRSNHLSQ